MLLRLNSSTFSDANHRIIRRPLPLNLSPLFTLPPSFSRSSRHPSLGIWVTRKKYVARNSSLVPFFFFFLFFLSLVRGEATATSRESLKTQQLDNSLVFYNRSSLLLSIINSPPPPPHYPLSKFGYSRATWGRDIRVPADFSPTRKGISFRNNGDLYSFIKAATIRQGERHP